jgi:hypothetical protein
MINMSRSRVIDERSRHLRIQSRNRRKFLACYEAFDRRSDERFCHIKVGIWDSGIGGLSVAAAVQDLMVSAFPLSYVRWLVDLCQHCPRTSDEDCLFKPVACSASQPVSLTLTLTLMP